ncbi:MAG: hypothetical protein LC667_07600 [Thioalkalivibrio sp.]|nr:hypothetical protein [Thioalkalivibrio sp.]
MDKNAFLMSEGGSHLLRVPELDPISDVRVVRSEAQSYLDSLSGVAKLILGWDSPLKVGHILRRHPDGRADRFLEVESLRVETRISPVTLRVTRADGSVEERGPAYEARPWLRKARASESARRVLRLISEPDLNWVDLYRIMEIIHGDAGSSIHQWVSRKKLKRFKTTANSVGAVGDDARHGHETTVPPEKPMTLVEAKRLISGLARDWLNAEREKDKDSNATAP